MKRTKKLSLEEIKNSFTIIEQDELISIKAGSGSSGGLVSTTYTITDPTFNEIFAAVQSGNITHVDEGTYTNNSQTYTTTTITYATYIVGSTPPPKKGPHDNGYISPAQIQSEFGNAANGGTYESSYFSVIGELAGKLNTGISQGSYFFAFDSNIDPSLINTPGGVHSDPTLANQQTFLTQNFATASSGPITNSDIFGTYADQNDDIVTSLVVHTYPNSPPTTGNVVLITGYNGATGLYTYDNPQAGLYGQTAPVSSFNVSGSMAVTMPPGVH